MLKVFLSSLWSTGYTSYTSRPTLTKAYANITAYAIYRDPYTISYDANYSDTVVLPAGTHSESDNPLTLPYVYPKRCTTGFSTCLVLEREL